MAMRRAQYAEIREVDRTIQLDSLAILEEIMRHFYWKARILEGMGTEGDYDAVDRAWAETGKWAKEVAQFRHPKIEIDSPGRRSECAVAAGENDAQ